MSRLVRRSILGAALTFTSHIASAEDLSGLWVLKVENAAHQPVTTLTLRFAKAAASSCLAGAWRRVIVQSVATSDEKFFPAREPLSYALDGSKLTLGRNEICDDYVHLSGSLKKLPVRGKYYGFGLHRGTPMGYFSLDRQP